MFADNCNYYKRVCKHVLGFSKPPTYSTFEISKHNKHFEHYYKKRTTIQYCCRYSTSWLMLLTHSCMKIAKLYKISQLLLSHCLLILEHKWFNIQCIDSYSSISMYSDVYKDCENGHIGRTLMPKQGPEPKLFWIQPSFSLSAIYVLKWLRKMAETSNDLM